MADAPPSSLRLPSKKAFLKLEVCVCVCVYIYTYVYVYIHTHAYVQAGVYLREQLLQECGREQAQRWYFYICKLHISEVLNRTPCTGVRPRTGAALVFPHGDSLGALLHEGSAVAAGAKYVVRTDVLFL